jgi:hypothetical protein
VGLGWTAPVLQAFGGRALEGPAGSEGRLDSGPERDARGEGGRGESGLGRAAVRGGGGRMEPREWKKRGRGLETSRKPGSCAAASLSPVHHPPADPAQ